MSQTTGFAVVLSRGSSGTRGQQAIGIRNSSMPYCFHSILLMIFVDHALSHINFSDDLPTPNMTRWPSTELNGQKRRNPEQERHDGLKMVRIQ